MHPLQAMAKIGLREKVALFVPVSIAQYSVYEALAGELLPQGCHSTSLPAPEVALHPFFVCRSLSLAKGGPATALLISVIHVCQVFMPLATHNRHGGQHC